MSFSKKLSGAAFKKRRTERNRSNNQSQQQWEKWLTRTPLISQSHSDRSDLEAPNVSQIYHLCVIQA